MISPMESFIQAFFEIDKNKDGHIDKSELIELCKKEKIDPKMVDSWLEHFDVDKDGKISMEEFCRGLGLKTNEMVIERDRFQDQKAGKAPTLPSDTEIIASTMNQTKQKDVVDMFKNSLANNGGADADMRVVANELKRQLDEKYGLVWQVVILVGSYWMNFSHEPFQSMQFKHEKHVVLVWRTPTN